MDNLTMRDMREADRSAVVDLLWELNQFELTFADTRSSLRADASRCLDANELAVTEHGGAHVIAELDGQVVAYMCLVVDIAPAFVRADCRPHLRIADLIVKSTFRSRGIGRRLLSMAEEYARARALRHVLIGVVAGNAVAESLYSAVGYEPYVVERLKRLD